MRAVGEDGIGYKVPSYSCLWIKLITESRIKVDEYVKKVKKS